jgi:hypothetical protein
VTDSSCQLREICMQRCPLFDFQIVNELCGSMQSASTKKISKSGHGRWVL